MADTVLYEVSDGLATITLNRPEAMNALDIATKVALREAVQAAADDSAVRAVLLTAAGERAFCVGQDLKEHITLLASDREAGTGATMTTVKEHYNPIVRALAGMAKPVVAGVNGSPRAPVSGSPWPRTTGSWRTRRASTRRSPGSP